MILYAGALLEQTEDKAAIEAVEEKEEVNLQSTNEDETLPLSNQGEYKKFLICKKNIFNTFQTLLPRFSRNFT